MRSLRWAWAERGLASTRLSSSIGNSANLHLNFCVQLFTIIGMLCWSCYYNDRDFLLLHILVYRFWTLVFFPLFWKAYSTRNKNFPIFRIITQINTHKLSKNAYKCWLLNILFLMAPIKCITFYRTKISLWMCFFCKLNHWWNCRIIMSTIFCLWSPFPVFWILNQID